VGSADHIRSLANFIDTLLLKQVGIIESNQRGMSIRVDFVRISQEHLAENAELCQLDSFKKIVNIFMPEHKT